MRKFSTIGSVLLIVLSIILTGCTQQLIGAYFRTNEYYETPEKAIEKADVLYGDEEILKQIGLVKITDNMAVYVGLTKGEELILFELHTKNGEYASIGDFSMYANNAVENSQYNGIPSNKSFLYDESGDCEGSFKYGIYFDKVEESEGENIKVVVFEEDKYHETLYFVYTIGSETAQTQGTVSVKTGR